MMKSVSLITGLCMLLAVASLTGCKSMKKNPAGVGMGEMGMGSGMGAGMGSDGIYSDGMGNTSMGDRFTGGTEYPGMFEPIYFDYDSSVVNSSERAKVEAVAQSLTQNNNHAVIIEGHSDERGSNEYNLALGERRAQAIRTYLIDLGIGAERIQTKSFGEENPASTGHDEEAWSVNRRGDFVLYY
ncbi:MAG: peptidoglycan-associated lipoprotein Pal [Kiritimatiellaceae bacterium]|nr:peptidoglycan-associated lipoprotein Pal [Kiritimatiellaceae bacterium]